MSRRFHIAAKQLTGAISAYAKRFDYLEVILPRSGDPQAPSAATMRPSSVECTRRNAPPAFTNGVRTPPRIHPAAGVMSARQLGEQLAGLAEGDALEHHGLEQAGHLRLVEAGRQCVGGAPLHVGAVAAVLGEHG